MGMLYTEINIGDVFESPLPWVGSDITYEVIDKAPQEWIKVRVRSENWDRYPVFPFEIWRSAADVIFKKRIFCASKQLVGRVVP